MFYSSQVDPPGPEDMNVTLLENYVSNGSNLFDQLIQAGSTSSALTLAATMASMLNHIDQGGKQNASEGNQTEDNTAIEDAKRRIDNVSIKPHYNTSQMQIVLNVKPYPLHKTLDFAFYIGSTPTFYISFFT